MHFSMLFIQNIETVPDQERRDLVNLSKLINSQLLAGSLLLSAPFDLPNIIRYQPLDVEGITIMVSRIANTPDTSTDDLIVSDVDKLAVLVLGDNDYRNKALDVLATMMVGNIENEPYHSIIIPKTLYPHMLAFTNFTKEHHLYMMDFLVFDQTPLLTNELEKVTTNLLSVST